MSRKRIESLWVLGIVLAASMAFQVEAETTELDAIDHGFYQIDDSPTAWNGFHNAVNTNYVARVSSATEQNRNFFVFDLSGVTEEIVGATLRIESVSTSASGNTYTLYDVETEIATLRTSHFETAAGAGNAEGRAIFEDLGTGLEYGSTQVTAVNALCNPNVFPGTDPQCPSFVEEIEFNAFGLAALNSATGLFAVGGRINAGEVFASSGGNIGDFSVTLVLGASVNDTDADGISDGADNCPTAHNPFQDDHDEDGVGDVCDVDDDNDMVADVRDNCPLIPNTAQDDDDFDGLGNPCDSVFDSGNVVQYIEDVASTSVIDITNVNVPGGNGMIAKLTDSDGVVQRVGNAVSAFSADLIDAETYVLLLEDALKKLKAFENQLLAKIGNGKIADPEATNLLDNSAEMRGTIEDLIGAAGG